MNCYECKESGIHLKVRIVTRSSKNAFLGLVNDRLKIAINAVPEKGKANQMLIKWLSKELEICQNQVIIHSGTVGKDKELVLPLKCLNKVKELFPKNMLK